jgi:hypothetical protein
MFYNLWHYNMQFSWILFVKQIFNECGFSNIWETELFDNVDYLKCVINQRLEDQFLQNWNSLVQNSPNKQYPTKLHIMIFIQLTT